MSPGEVPPPVDYLTLVAAGDNLYHTTILTCFAREGGYDFTPIYEAVKPCIVPADIAFVNQETVFVEKDFSGYPRFGSPEAAGAALADAGFDVVNHATNHALDQGEAGLRFTMNYWDTHPPTRYIGIYPSEEERGTPLIIEKNNFQVGFLAYTYGTNSIPFPRGKEYLVSLIDEEAMAAAIDALRPLCDLLIVSMHWGIEYETAPSRAQKKTALFLAEHNVDIIIGHHPHVLEPREKLPRPDGGVTLCFYSLGNFISSQMEPGGYVLLGGLMYVRLKKDMAGIRIEEEGIIPVVTHYEKGWTGYKIYPLYEYTDELAAKHMKKSGKDALTLKFFQDAALSILGEAQIRGNPFVLHP